MTEQDYRISIGAYVLGALSPDEARQLEQHLRTCPDCRREYVELSEMAAALAMVPRELAIESVAPSDDLLLQRTRRGQRAGRGRPRRGLLVAAAAALVVAGAVGAIATAGRPGGSVPAPVRAAHGTPTSQTIRTIGATNSAAGVAANVSLVPSVQGTVLQVTLNGVAKGLECQLWAVAQSGQERLVDQKKVTDPAAGLAIGGTAPWRENQMTRLDVQTPQGAVLVSVPLT